MRSRIIRPEFWNDEKLASVSRAARLTFAGLWMTSDDYGVSKGHLSWIKSQIFPYDDDIKLSDFGKWIDELKGIGAVLPFESNGEKYLYIKTFTKHQKVDHPSSIRNPEPPENILESLANGSRSARAGNPLLTETETEAETETIKRPRKLFQKPSIDEVRAYIQEKGYTINPETFMAKYEANGWMVGRNPMKDWKASIRYWQSNNFGSSPAKPTHERIRPNTEEPAPLSREERIAHKKALLEQYKGQTDPRLVNMAKAIERQLADLQAEGGG